MQIGIINYNMGNLASVQNAFNAVGVQAQIQADADKISRYDKLILPGVGAFGDAMTNLKTTGMQEAIKDFAAKGGYMMGICLGMQLLFEKSFEFGEHQGLGLVRGEVIKFSEQKNLKIPHMGWNTCHFSPQGKTHPLLAHIPDGSYLYFVHSYHALCADPKDLLATCTYGDPFPAIIAKDNILGLQPHPEKSHHIGLKILSQFAAL
ncbi:imidazole glycerol phosphate synthase, glutamine amidotransferase subunit [Helicobacter sp. 12S02634-8]|uniref:imidazole glycerol phosphate synthase subunit HisH n=1 Tax=Helicobacter sp. 12S02634-8 TaxID=1476199 RepID=UPI000BA57526|nr:imidazole glycerol phosphate synthase subunit HisH [Helicobacter sp. 12S02634-8]PAF46529.1 imidazole glycerol phosphate synthase, glutamine amidotransferase subunit [Helicobacter sp. 12S02634-8]